MRPLLLAIALARAGALLDSPGLRGTTQSVVDEPAEPVLMLTDCRRCRGARATRPTTTRAATTRALRWATPRLLSDANVGCDQTKAAPFSTMCSTTATAQQCLDAAGGHDAQKGPCNY